jgi:5-methylthioadenosine/S-adenosylhomocysteine deaminase
MSQPEAGTRGPRTLIRGAYVITMDDDLGILPSGDILIEGSSIAAVGPSLDADNATVVDGSDRIALPGFVDTHRHMYSGLLRGCGNEISYEEYFKSVVLTYGANFTPDDTYTSVRLGMAEAVDSGITTMHAWEHNLISPDHAEASLRALQESGMRGRFSYGPPNIPMSLTLEHVERMRDTLFAEQPGGGFFTGDGRIHLGIATRGVELENEAIWRPELEFAQAAKLPVTCHFLAPGQIDMIDEAGFLGPHFVGVHALHAGPEQMAKLAAAGTPLSIAHGAMGRAGNGWSEPVALMNAGVRVCISTDSTAACDNGDFYILLRMILVATRAIHEDPTAYTVEEILRHATIDGASALGLGDVTGSISPGKQADIQLIRTDQLNLTPLNAPLAQTVLSATARNVDAVWIGGICRKQAGELMGVDVPELVRSARRAVAALSERIGQPIA